MTNNYNYNCNKIIQIMYILDSIVFVIFNISILCILIDCVICVPGSSGNKDYEVDNGDFYCVEGSTDC